jgi:hypothetical protein
MPLSEEERKRNLLFRRRLREHAQPYELKYVFISDPPRPNLKPKEYKVSTPIISPWYNGPGGATTSPVSGPVNQSVAINNVVQQDIIQQALNTNKKRQLSKAETLMLTKRRLRTNRRRRLLLEASNGQDTGDTYYNNVSLLFAMDGADAATTVADLSGTPHAIVFENNAQLDTAKKKFGTASLLLDGTVDSIYVTDPGTDFDFGTGDFTIEMHVLFSKLPSAATADIQTLISMDQTGLRSWRLQFDATNKLQWTYSTNGTTVTTVADTAAVIDTAEQWYHVAVTRATNVIRMFIDGVLVHESDEGSQNYVTAGARRVSIGRMFWSGFEYELYGSIDNLRVTKGVARYTATFTPPTAAFATSV